jgi:hypothetical protein
MRVRGTGEERQGAMKLCYGFHLTLALGNGSDNCAAGNAKCDGRRDGVPHIVGLTNYEEGQDNQSTQRPAQDEIAGASPHKMDLIASVAVPRDSRPFFLASLCEK